ncbi:MAG: cytotoxic translational repressor of toxin-antitoxin stability system [Bacteriovoracaceae bacterium]|nr:cytotoxic translational repressor of toxin-antitoxin stability system [Bacteriovoracaceae bacterium]
MKWEIRLTKKANKGVRKLPEEIQLRLLALIKKMEIYGPFLKSWSKIDRLKFKNYGKLEGHGNKYHCHLKKGCPTYVACWEIHSNIILVELYYVGSHEKAPY